MTAKRPALSVVFDWNGTLIADAASALRGVNAVMRHLGHATTNMAGFRRHFDVPVKRLYEGLGCTEEQLEDHAPVIQRVFFDTYNPLSRATRLRQGARTILRQLREMESETLILSNHSRPDIEAHARRLGILEHVDAVLAHEVFGPAYHTRGKGERLTTYWGAWRPALGLIIGDSPEEVHIGRTLGLVTVAITDGFSSTTRLRAARPDHLIRSLTALPAILRQHHAATGAAS